jgi:hypothetical protein
MVLQEVPVYPIDALSVSSDMDMATKLSMECPCGFSFVTPHGEDDAVAVAQLHVERVHKADYPQGISRSEALTHLKSAK